MSTMRRTTRAPILPPTVPPANDGRVDGPRERTAPPGRSSHASVAVAFVVLLLVLATTSQGAFAVSRWAPLDLFALAVLIGGLLAGGGLAIRSRAAIVALTGIWGLAAWSLLSMLWATSAGDAFIAGDRMILYAAIATLPFVLPLPRRSLAMAGWAITAGIGVIAVYVLVRLLSNGGPLFLAGRLNGPINYRNATALLFAMPVLPCVVAVASRTYRRGIRAAALGLATLCLGLAFLTQSRGILLGLGAGELVILALGPDRVRRAWVSALPIAAVALASSSLLRPFHAFDGGSGFVSTQDITVAARGLAVATVASLAVGLVIALFDNGLRPNSPQMRHVRRAARFGLAIGVVAVVALAGAAAGNPVTYLHRKWDEFTSLQSTTPTTTRLLTVGGQRYDLWRVAVKEFEAHPLDGVGADNYEFGYYRYRRTNRNLNDPHSIVFALMSETGAVGLVLLALFLGGLAVALGSGWRRLGDAARRPAAAAAAAGAVLIGQSTVDWIWLIPGLTAIGIFSLALAAAQAGQGAGQVDDAASEPDPARRGTVVARLGRAIALGALLVAVVGVLALFLSDAYIQRARTVVSDPAAQLSSARIAGSLDPWSVTPHYLEASALETLGDRPAAYGELRKALALEPTNFATLGVLGDFEARGHDFARARSYYRRALALDPLDTGLQQLARIGLTPRARSRAGHRASGHAGRRRR